MANENNFVDVQECTSLPQGFIKTHLICHPQLELSLFLSHLQEVPPSDLPNNALTNLTEVDFINILTKVPKCFEQLFSSYNLAL